MTNQTIGAVMVVGGGIAGIQTSLDLAGSGFKIYLVEKASSIGGVMAKLDKTFPTNDCSMCIMSPKLVEVGRHPNVEIMTLSEIEDISGTPGNFTVNIIQHPRYIHMEKCIACGMCAEKCPKKVDDAFNEALNKRKSAHVLYPQAVPLKYVIDEKNCIYLTKGKCRACEKACPAGAINFDDKEKRLKLNVGAIIMAPGYQTVDPSHLYGYHYSSYEDVVTSIEFERILSASGPFMGHVVRPSDHKEPEKIAWIQCVGSRDTHEHAHSYCSSVCCMYAIKQTIIAKEHIGAHLDCAVFYMDIRSHGKDFERCYNDAREKHGVRFIHTRVPVIEKTVDGKLSIRYTHQDGRSETELFDMVVLSVGLETSPETLALAQKLDIDLTQGKFVESASFRPVAASKEGFYVCGVFAGPKDIPQSVIEAGSAAAEAGVLLSEARDTLTVKKEVREERNILGLRPRIGVFVCYCGINIGGTIDVQAVRDYAAGLPFVEYAGDNLYTCSQDSQDNMSKIISEKQLTRVIVAACSPKTHEPLFQETLVDAGLNKYVFEMVNIRNQNSWVHKDDPEKATQKAKDLVRMAVAKAALLEPLDEAELEIDQRALVAGGGISGMAAAKALADQGYHVTLVEQSEVLGGNARSLFMTWKGEDIQKNLADMIDSVNAHSLIDVHTQTQMSQVEGFVGNFKTTLQSPDKETVVEHGIAVVATGGTEFKPDEYLYGKDPRVLTHLDLDRKLIGHDPELKNAKSAVFIQCVGSRIPERPYCSKLCCTHSIESAMKLKEINPDMNVYILFRDIRTYGEREYLYQKARAAGVVFVRYALEDKPLVTDLNEGLCINVWNGILNQRMTIWADILTLASAVISPGNEKLAQFFKVPVNEDGFFVEAHAKLGPSEFSTDGVYLCGLAHYPKPIDESIAQAQAAVSRATTLLAKKNIRISGTVAKVNPVYCSSCGVCVEICPYAAPSMIGSGPFTGRAEVNPVLCKGCGLCVASCRSGAINLKGFGTDQIMSMIQNACAVG